MVGIGTKTTPKAHGAKIVAVSNSSRLNNQLSKSSAYEVIMITSIKMSPHFSICILRHREIPLNAQRRIIGMGAREHAGDSHIAERKEHQIIVL